MGDLKDPLEIEVKFALPAIKPYFDRLIQLGCRSTGRVFELNLRYEDKDNCFLKNRSLLRLRKSRNAVLTYKAEPDEMDDQFKIHKELEVQVSDFDTMARILECIGFHRVQLYEKWRETFFLEGATLCFDILPFGFFLEIEGEKTSVRNAARCLDLPWSKRILSNYLAIFASLKTTFHLSFDDITFDNFKGLEIDCSSYFEHLEAGP